MWLSLFFLSSDNWPFILVGNIAGLSLIFLTFYLIKSTFVYTTRHFSASAISARSFRSLLKKEIAKSKIIHFIYDILLWIWIIIVIAFLRFWLMSIAFWKWLLVDILLGGSGMLMIFFIASSLLYKLYTKEYKWIAFFWTFVGILTLLGISYNQGTIGNLGSNLGTTLLFLWTVGIFFRLIQYLYGFLLDHAEQKGKDGIAVELQKTLPYSFMAHTISSLFMQL